MIVVDVKVVVALGQTFSSSLIRAGHEALWVLGHALTQSCRLSCKEGFDSCDDVCWRQCSLRMLTQSSCLTGESLSFPFPDLQTIAYERKG